MPGRKRLSVGSGSAPAGNGKKRRSGDDLIAVHDGRSGPAEAFRTLRTNLLFARGAGEQRSLVVTSALSAEGKTTTAANLAGTYAQQGLRVLVIDRDLRKPRIGELFDMPRKPGLTELVLHNAALGEVIREYAPVEKLWILPSGTLPPNPTELLGGARMRAALETLRDQFDILILDTPPLSGGADGALLGANVDGVLMVVRAGQKEEDAARLAGRQLHTVGARLVGAVLNDPDGETPKYGYYYAYQYCREGVK